MRAQRLPTVLLLTALFATPLALGPRSAHADTVVDASKRADELNVQGRALADAGKLDEALAALTEAWTLKKAYDIAGNLALVESMTGHPDRALEHVEFALRTFPTSGKPAHREGLEKLVKKLRPEVVLVTFAGLPPDARITVNDRPAEKSPLEGNVYAMPGSIAVSVEHTGDEPFTSTSTGTAGSEVTVTVALRPKKGADPIVPVAPERRPLWPAILGFSVAGAGLVVGVSTLIAAESTSLEGCASPAACADASDDINVLRSTALWSFVGAGVLTGASVGLAVWAGGGKADTPPRAALQLLPTLGGATLRGTF